MIHQSLALSQAEIGALASLPVLLFSFAAVPGSILIARFGAFRVLVGGILLTGLGSALRGAAPDAAMLFAATFVMGIGIAIMQPSLPPVVREWVPRKIALGTAVYSNGLLMGEALAASLTIPVVLPLAGGDWRLALVRGPCPSSSSLSRACSTSAAGPRSPCTRRRAYGGPTGSRRSRGASGSSPAGARASTSPPTRSSGRAASRGKARAAESALSANNWLQIPASLLLLFFPGRLMMRRWPFMAMGVTFTLATIGLVLAPDASIVAYSGVIGFCSAFVLTSTLPPLPPSPLRTSSHPHS